MILADTSIWIEFFKSNHVIKPVMTYHLEQSNIATTDWIFAELLQGAKNDRECNVLTKYWQNVTKINIGNLWISAGEYSSKHKLYSKGVGIIDVATLIAARKIGAQLWTLDKKLQKLLNQKEKFTPNTYKIPGSTDIILKDLYESYGRSGTRLRQLRINNGFTQTTLANQLGMPRSSISQIERGNSLIDKTLAKQLAKALEIDYRNLL